MNTVFQNQKAFFNSNETKSIDFRKQQLRKLKKILKEKYGTNLEKIFREKTK